MPEILTESQFADWANKLRPILRRAAARRCGETEAPDLVQETLLRAWQRLARFDAADGPQKFRAWLLRILEYVCQDYLRAAALHPETLLPPEEWPDAVSDFALSGDSHAARRKSLFETIERAGLTARQELCLRLALDGHTQEQIAAHLSLRQQTIAEHLAAARRKLAPLRSRYLFADLGAHWFDIISHVTIYHPPKGVWDHDGTAAQRERRRQRPPK